MCTTENDIPFVRPDASIPELTLAFEEVTGQHLPVVEEGRVLGIVHRSQVEAQGKWIDGEWFSWGPAHVARDLTCVVPQVWLESSAGLLTLLKPLVEHTCVVVVDEVGCLVDLFTDTDGVEEALELLSGSELAIDFAQTGPPTLSGALPALAAMHEMGRRGVRHLVLSDPDAPLGVVSIRDLEAAALECRLPLPVAAVVDGRTAITAADSCSVRMAAQLMVDHGIGCVPLVNDGVVVALLTRRDVIRAVLATLRPDGAVQASEGLGSKVGRSYVFQMQAVDLDIHGLLDFDPEAGLVRFAGDRALVIDAVAIGLLRKHLVDSFGLAASRSLLTQFGFAHGWRMAEALKERFDWRSKLEWQHAGSRIHDMAGLFSSVSIHGDATTIQSSFEAEQHLLHFGRSEVCTCWTIAGLLSGYRSRTEDRELFVLEDRCVGKGDPNCHLISRTRAEWGHRRVDELAFYNELNLQDCLEVSLQSTADSLKAVERRLRAERRALAKLAPEADPSGLVATSPSMRKMLDLARRAAHVDSTVLITGESGAGKERVAQLMHDESGRSAGPFIAVNCGAISESLLESELFGHARGAFTNASSGRIGLFEAANTGTLLLDEIGEVSPQMQVKLLRVLQEREVRRVGENTARPIDVRIIAATNRNLVDQISDGTMREDLYYRLKVIEIRVPPLRERVEDILVLAEVFLQASARRMKRSIDRLDATVAKQLLRHSWPGNVRELENAMERAAALASGGRVQLDDLPEELRPPNDVRQASPSPGAKSDRRTLQEVEKDYILAALARNGGNRSRTASFLNIGIATLYRKLKAYGLTDSSV